jgi:hypothetical protein
MRAPAGAKINVECAGCVELGRTREDAITVFVFPNAACCRSGSVW